MSNPFIPGASLRTLMSRFWLPLGAMALLLALAPGAGLAYVIKPINGFTSFVCNDGTRVICSAGGVQIDCPKQNGDRHCAGHGGLAYVDTGTETAVDYRGTLDLRAMQCSNCGEAEQLPSVYAGWMGTCSDKAMMTCSDMDPACASRQSAFKDLCMQLRGVLTSTWYIEVPPQNACYAEK